MPEPQFPANPILAIPAISIARQSLQDISRRTKNPDAKSLNFERVRSRKGYFTIRANYSIRVLLKETKPQEFELVAVGNHDYIYERHF